jgi:hypothetical protein
MAALILRHRRAVYCISLAVTAAGIVVDLYGAHKFGMF